MFCPQCGQQQITASLRFCSRCGFPLEAVSASAGNWRDASRVFRPSQQGAFTTPQGCEAGRAVAVAGHYPGSASGCAQQLQCRKPLRHPHADGGNFLFSGWLVTDAVRGGCLRKEPLAIDRCLRTLLP